MPCTQTITFSIDYHPYTEMSYPDGIWRCDHSSQSHSGPHVALFDDENVACTFHIGCLDAVQLNERYILTWDNNGNVLHAVGNQERTWHPQGSFQRIQVSERDRRIVAARRLP